MEHPCDSCNVDFYDCVGYLQCESLAAYQRNRRSIMEERMEYYSEYSEILVKSSSDLHPCADVQVEIVDHKRYIRWMAGDESDAQPPTQVYNAPHWVWVIYQQGIERGKKEALSGEVQQ